MNVPCRQCNTPVDESTAVCPVCGATNPAQRYGPPPGSATMQTTAVNGGVVIRDIDIPFGRMVVLILKFFAASIPAYLLLMVIMFMLMGVFAGVMAAVMPDVFTPPAQTGL
jgi:hypothetical protein